MEYRYSLKTVPLEWKYNFQKTLPNQQMCSFKEKIFFKVMWSLLELQRLMDFTLWKCFQLNWISSGFSDWAVPSESYIFIPIAVAIDNTIIIASYLPQQITECLFSRFWNINTSWERPDCILWLDDISIRTQHGSLQMKYIYKLIFDVLRI